MEVFKKKKSESIWKWSKNKWFVEVIQKKHSFSSGSDFVKFYYKEILQNRSQPPKKREVIIFCTITTHGSDFVKIYYKEILQNRSQPPKKREVIIFCANHNSRMWGRAKLKHVLAATWVDHTGTQARVQYHTSLLRRDTAMSLMTSPSATWSVS